MAKITVAIAVPESHAAAKLKEMRISDPNQLYGSTTGACARCGATFAIIFMNDIDPNNPNYARVLEGRIAGDCKDGKHTFELLLDKET
jgi:hypothetical protein